MRRSFQLGINLDCDARSADLRKVERPNPRFPIGSSEPDFAEPFCDLVERPPFLVRLHREWGLDPCARCLVGKDRKTVA